MTQSKPDSVNTIADLITNSGFVIEELYKAVKVDLSIAALMNEQTPLLYVLTQDLQAGCKFILMEIGALCKAELSVDNAYEKRFYIKNIQAAISEGYKLLYNYGKLRKKSLWKKLVTKIHDAGISALEEEGKIIDKKLEAFGNAEIDKRLRDLTFHYDDEMIEVYLKTLSVDNEEKVVRRICSFFDILQQVLLFTDNVDSYVQKSIGVDKPGLHSSIRLEVNPTHRIVCDYINQNDILGKIFRSLFQGKSVESLDLMAKQWSFTKRVDDYIDTNAPLVGPMQESEDVRALTNMLLLLNFMMLDMAAIVDIYLKSSSDIEYALNLRRICITKVSTIAHLFGYDENEQNHSMWKRINDVLPTDSEELKNTADNIGLILKDCLVTEEDKDLRQAYVHLFDNNKATSNISNVIKAIEAIEPIVQMAEIHLLLKIYNVLMAFTRALMDELVRKSNERRIQSAKNANDKFDEVIQKIKESEVPLEQKEKFVDMMMNMKDKINSLFSKVEQYTRES